MTKPIPAEALKKTIAYLYLLFFCPTPQLADFKRSTASMRNEPARQSGLNEQDYFAQALPEACRRIVAFQQATREPDPDIVEALLKTALPAGKNADTLTAFKAQMDKVASLPGRAKSANRLHRNKGCGYCAAPCMYGYFTLVSEPQFSHLQMLIAREADRPATSQTPLMPVYKFAMDHLLTVSGAQDGYCERMHLANLAYCLLMLSMAKSRKAFPEKQIQIFQSASQKYMQGQVANWHPEK